MKLFHDSESGRQKEHQTVCQAAVFYFLLCGVLLEEKVLAGNFLLRVFDRLKLVDSGAPVGGVTTKGNIELFQKLVHSGQQALWRMSSTLD